MDPYDNDDDFEPEDAWEDDLSDDLSDEWAEQLSDEPPAEPAAATNPYYQQQQHHQQQEHQPYGEPQPERLQYDVNCIHCGYNLRGQLPHGACPECGAAVSRSLRTDQLSSANPQWLGSLRTGTLWILIGLVVTVVMIVVGMIVGIAEAASMSPSSSPYGPGPGGSAPAPVFTPATPSAGMAAFEVISTLILNGIGLYAYYRLTAPEPNQIRPQTTRAVARWGILPGYAIGIPAALLSVVPSSPIVIAGATLQIIGSIFSITGFIAVMLYLRYLAKRIPNPSLAKQTSTVLWGMIGSIAFIFLALILIFAIGAGGGGPDTALAALGCLMCPAGIGFLVFAIWWIVLMCLYHGAFTRAHNAALAYERQDRYGATQNYGGY